MSVKYDGKSPNKLWYFWQYTKAIVQTPFQYETADRAKSTGKSLGKFVGIAAATSIVLGALPAVVGVATLGIVPLCLSLGGYSWALHHGWQGIQKAGALKSSSFVYSYVKGQEDKWVDRQRNGNVFKRTWKSLKEKVSNIGSKIPMPLVKAGKWLGIGAAVAGIGGAVAAGLSYAGVPAFATGATATSVLSGIASAGAVIGLSAAAAVATVTGLAVAAIPIGLGISAWCRKKGYANDPNRPVFGKKKPSAPGGKPPGDGPIDKGVVFAPKAASFEFNDNATSGTPANDSLSEERRKAAEQRANSRKRGGSGNRFQ